MYPYNQFTTTPYHYSYFYDNSENTKRKRDEYESYKFIEEEDQILSEDSDDEELHLMQGYQPDRKRTKSSTPTHPNNNLSHQQQLPNNNIQHHNNESGSIVENNHSDCMMVDDDEEYTQQQESSLQLFVPSNLQNNPYAIQQFEYKRRQMYNHNYRKEQERKLGEIELKQSIQQGETNFRLNPILRYLHNERKNRINSPFE